jgi:hypothetical protein
MDEVSVQPIAVEATELAEVVAVEFEIVARGRASGVESNQRAFALCRAREGLLYSIEFHDSLAEAKAAASA